MAAEVRIARDDAEIDAAARTVGTAFLRLPDEEMLTWRRNLVDRDRLLVADEDGAICGTALSFATRLTLPGGAAAPTCGVSAVGVLPTHRRRGHLTRLMELQLGDAIARGEVLAALVAAEWPIYGRYGYGMAVPAATYELDTRHAQFLHPALSGAVELVDRATLRDVAPKVFERHLAVTPGSIEREDARWDVHLGVNPRPGSKDDGTRFGAVRRDGSGEIDGYVTYSTVEGWDRNRPDGRLEVGDLIAATDEAYADLWRYLAGVDWTSSVKASPRPIDEPLQFLLVDGRSVTQTHRGDHIWLRILDVAAVLEARRYRAAHRIVLEVSDDSLGRGGRFALDASPEGTTCVTTTDEPDLALTIASLGAASLGGTSFASLAAAGLVRAESPGALDRADALFAWTPAPWCSTGF